MECSNSVNARLKVELGAAVTTIAGKDEKIKADLVIRDKLVLQVTQVECENRILEKKLSVRLEVQRELETTIENKNKEIASLKMDKAELNEQVAQLEDINKSQVRNSVALKSYLLFFCSFLSNVFFFCIFLFKNVW